LITEARHRIATRPEKYVNHVYGEDEAGGTSFLYLSPVPFDKLGFPTLDRNPQTRNSETIMGLTPITIIGALATVGGFYWLTERSDETQEVEEE
jgi:formate dehydrogenase iron-sulfur subunit